MANTQQQNTKKGTALNVLTNAVQTVKTVGSNDQDTAIAKAMAEAVVKQADIEANKEKEIAQIQADKEEALKETEKQMAEIQANKEKEIAQINADKEEALKEMERKIEEMKAEIKERKEKHLAEVSERVELRKLEIASKEKMIDSIADSAKWIAFAASLTTIICIGGKDSSNNDLEF